MGTVTGYTAEKMDEISDSTIIDGRIEDPDLILVTRGGTEINAGQVKGDQGDVGPQGPAGPTSIEIVTSGSHPVPPDLFEGLAIYETDTKKFLVYNGVRFDPPWNMPWGIRSVIENLAAQTGIGTTRVDLTGLVTASISFVANRRIRLKGICSFDNNNDIGIFYLRIREGGTDLAVGHTNATELFTLNETLIAETVITPTAGSHTYKLSAHTSAGEISRTNLAGLLIVEDIGPNGNPA